jgi:formylglycine-generating enzyme required for sulfatase activity
MMGRIIKGALVVVLTSVMATLTINAGDNFNNISESLLGSVLNIEQGTCPDDMVFVSTESGGFCIDRYEASPSDECLFENPANQDESRANIDKAKCVPVSEPQKTPWVFIAQHQASLACAKAGKRLPTNDEWYRAAMGTPDSPGAGVCGIGKQVTSPFQTATFQECVSIAGAYDMIGNVWEWVDETVQDGVYRKQTLPQEGYVSSVGTDGVPTETTKEGPDDNFNEDYFWINAEGVRGMFRGGYWGLEERAGVYGVYSVMSPSFVGPGLGFRCVK